MRNRKYPSHSQPVCQQQLAATMLFVGDLKVKGMPDCINNEYVASKLSKTLYNADFCCYIKAEAAVCRVRLSFIIKVHIEMAVKNS